MNKIKLTIFTPTYNRAYVLLNLYESLKRQSRKDFEWVIIDDDSVDETENLVKKWITENNDFPIRYYKQKHGGKHRALNKAFDLASGEFFFTVDSDDYITDDSVKHILNWIKDVENMDNICGVSGLKISKEGKSWGGNPLFNNSDFIDATNFEREKYNLLGDKAEIYRTSLLQKYRFPEFEDEYFVTEDVCYQEIAAAGFKIRWYNEPIYVCEYLDDGLTNQGANDIIGHVNNYKGYCYWIKRGLILKPLEFKYLLLKEYLKTTKYMKKNLKSVANDIDMNIFKLVFYLIVIFPVSFIKRKFLKIIK